MGWVNDADGDGYPDLLIHERPSRSYGEVLRDWFTSSSTNASWVRLRSGRTGEVLQELYGEAPIGKRLKGAYGVLPSNGRLAVWRRKDSATLELFDGHQVHQTTRHDLARNASWTRHPQTSEFIRVQHTARSFVLIGDAGRKVPMPQGSYPANLLWSRSSLNGETRWTLVVASDLIEIPGDQFSFTFIDWEEQRILASEQLEIKNYMKRYGISELTVAMELGESGVPSAKPLWEILNKRYDPVRMVDSFDCNRSDNGRALFISRDPSLPEEFLYLDLETKQPIWKMPLNSFIEGLAKDFFFVSILDDHNGDGFSELSITGIIQSPDGKDGWEGGDPARVALLLDGATGELLTPNN